MPNWLYLVTSSFYLLGLSLWIGGAVALGALAAPTIFRLVEPRSKAGETFGAILRKFSRLRLAAVVVIVGTAMLRYVLWERNAGQYNRWIAVRWAAITFLAASVLIEIFYLEPAISSALATADGRPRFERLHRAAEGLMKVGLIAAVVALFFH